MGDVKIAIPQNEDKNRSSWLGVRHYQFFMFFMNLVIFYGIRTALSVAIISMTAETPPGPSIPTYPEWDDTDTVLSSFFWGYVVTQVGAGQLSELYGPKWFLCTTMTICAIVNIIIPVVAANFGSTGVMVCRMVEGLNQGFLYPSTHSMISRWAPLEERARIAGFVYGGSSVGIILAMLITGAIADSKWGWPGAFYGYGAAGLVWVLVFAIFAKNSPSDHKSITQDERNYIENSNSVTESTEKIPTPWVGIVTSLPVWATFLAGAASCWGGFTLLTEIPSYMSEIMGFDIKSNSALSALPYVAHYILGLSVSPISDMLISRNLVSATNCRKIFNGLATFVPAAGLIWLAFIDNSQKELGVALLVIAVGFSSCVSTGYLVNMLDLAPNHTGTIVGIVNGSSNVFSILGPLSVGLLGSDKSDPFLWRQVFLLAAGIYVGCGIFYSIFASAQLQSWNNLNEDEKVKNEKKTSL